MGLDGFFLISDYTETRGGRVSYRGHGVYGWDPQDQCYTMHWFDGMGSIPKAWAKGKWEGNVLMFPPARARALALHLHDSGKPRVPFQDRRLPGRENLADVHGGDVQEEIGAGPSSTQGDGLPGSRAQDRSFELTRLGNVT